MSANPFPPPDANRAEIEAYKASVRKKAAPRYCAVSNKPESIPLRAPDGEVFTWACGLCRRVHASVSSWGPPNKKQRASLAESHKAQADGCCICDDCGKVEKGAMLRCEACEKRERAKWAAHEASEEAKSAEQIRTESARASLHWVRGEGYPIATIVAKRYGWEGATWLAFPGLPDEMSGNAFGDDPESHEFWTSDAAKFVGRGATPDEALADLVRLANENDPERKDAA